MFVATVTSYALGYDPVGAISGALGISPRSAATTTGVWEADTSTQNSWYEGDLGVSGQGNNSTQNTGRIWTDKSVYSGDATLTNASSGETTFTVENDEGTALVELSALSSAARISGVTTASQPLDIVLVLDASGSMDNVQSNNNPYLDSYAEAYNVRNGNGLTYYVLVDGEYRQVQYSNRQRRWYYGSDWSPSYVTPMTSADDTTPGRVHFYTRMTKMDALQQAADNFIAQTAAENAEITDQTQQHRIALVKFAGNSSDSPGNNTYTYDGNTYNYSQIMSGFQYVDGNTSRTLQNTVNSLDGNGSTRADYGLAHANRLMNGRANGGYGDGARSYAQRVVIFFTDGQPTSSDGFEGSVAARAINEAYELKDNGALVFSIGVFDGAMPSDTSGSFNRYMNAVSSNYPDAQCGDYEWTWNGPEWQQNNNFSDLQLGDRAPEDEQYYYAAEDAESLNSVFEAIYDRVTEGVATPPIANDGETTIGGQPVGYLTFTDQLGDYTEVKNFKRVIYAGREFSLDEETPTSIDRETGDTLYHFTGEVTANDIYGESNLADLIVRVHHENGRTGDTVTVEIPSSLLPLRLYTAGPNDDGGIDNDVKDAYPIRIFYTVGLKDGLVDNNGTLDTSQIDSSYITSHTDANGNLVFHSNSYAGRNNSATTAGGAGTTTATFTPATTNAFYYFTSDTPIYNTQNTNDPAGTLQPGSQYWYMRTYYYGGEEQQEWVQFTYDNNRLSEYVSTDENDHAYIESGAPRFTRANEFVAAKADGANVTDTAENSISPDWSGSGEVTVTLGNNGRIAYPMKGDLRIDKDVNWGDGTENPDKEFTYTVNFNGDETITGEFDYTKYTEDGTAIDNNGDELGEGQTTGTLADGGTVTLTDGQYTIVSDLPAGTTFEIVESTENGFTPSVQVGAGETQQSATVNGTVTSSATTQVTYTNKYDFTGTVTTTEAIGGSKVLTGRDWANGESFTFTISASNPSDAPMPENASVTLTDDGTYTEDEAYDFSFGTIEYEKPGTYTYTISEQNPYASGMNASSASYTVTVTVEDNGDGTMKTPVIKVEQTANDEGTTLDEPVDVTDGNGARFTNEFTGNDEYTVNLEGSKTYTDSTGETSIADTRFGFTLTPLGGKTDASLGDYDIDAEDVPKPSSDQATTNASGAFRFRNIVFDINDVGNTYYYTVTENLPDGVTADMDEDANTDGVQYQGMTYDQHVENVSIEVYQVTNDNIQDGQQVGDVVANVHDDADDITFANSYTPAPVQNTGDDAVTITKEVDGHAATDGQFSFTMSAADDATRAAIAAGQITGEGFEADDPNTDDVNEAVTQVSQATGAIAKDGSQQLTFPTLTFSQVGDYTFEVTENIPESVPSGWTYDTHTYTVTFRVSDNHSGQLSIETITEPSETNSPTFTNSYSADFNYLESAGGLVMSKTLNGYSMTQGQFSFTITGANEASTAKLSPADQSFSNPRGASSGSAVLWRVFRNMTFDEDDAGQTFTFTVHEVVPEDGAPAGYTYDTQDVTVAIEVIDNNDGNLYTVTTVTKGGQSTEYDSRDFQNGTASTYPTAVFTNSYKAEGTALESVNFDKELTGRDWKDTDSFEFTLAADADRSTVSDEALDASMPETTTFTATSGDRDFSFGAFSFKEAGAYVYTVNETQPGAGEDTQGVTYDSSTATIAVVVEDNGTGTLSIASGYPMVTGLGPADENGVYSFVNRYNADPVDLTQDTDSGLGVQKTVTGAPNEEDFSFTATFNADESTGTVDNIEGLTDDNTLTATISDGFAAGETKGVDFGTITISAPGTYVFDVVEDNAAAAPSAGWTYDDNTRQIVVTVTDNTEGELVAKTTHEGQETNDPVFTNSYTPESVTVGDDEAGFQVTKQVTGAPALSEFDFTLQLTSDNRSNVMVGSGDEATAFPENGIKMSTSGLEGHENSETVDFGDLTFTAVGDYVFTVAETTAQPDPANGWTYDNAARTITVHVTDEGFDGHLDATVEDNNPTVTNRYNHGTVTLTGDTALKVQKTVTGAPTDTDFTFVATFDAEASAAAENPGSISGIQGATEGQAFTLNAAVGDSFAEGDAAKTASFGEVTFTQPGTYIFDVEETNEDPAADSGWAYDQAIKTITVEVTDNGEGALVPTVTYSNDVDGAADADKAVDSAAAFTNSYEAAPVIIGEGDTVGITVKKTFTGRENGWGDDDNFQFTLTPVDNAPMPEGEGVDTITIGKPESGSENTNVFGAIEYNAVGEYRYTISEVVPADDDNAELDGKQQDGVTYDTHTANVTVAVTDDDHDGKLEASVSYDNDDATTPEDQAVEDAAAFTNTYAPSGETTTPDAGEGSIMLRKVLTGRDWAEGETFTFSIAAGNDEAANYLPDPAAATVSEPTGTDDNGNVYADFVGWTITYDQPGTYVYTVTEVPGDNPNPGIAYDGHTATVTVRVTDNNQGGYTAVAEVKDGTFTNKYQAGTVNYDAEGGLQIVKNLTGHDIAAGQFQFTLTATNDDAIEKLGGKTRVYDSTPQATSGNVASETIAALTNMTFDQGDAGKTFTFTMAETKGGGEGYTNDTHVYEIEIAVTDNTQGTLTVTTTVDGETVATYTASAVATNALQPVTLEFNNNYDAGTTTVGEGTSATIEATKTLTGRPMTADEFTFTVTDAKGNEVTTGSNAAAADGEAGAVTFGDITYTVEKLNNDATNGIASKTAGKNGATVYTYQYTVTETGGTGDGVASVANSFPVTVTVTDDGAGHLTAAVDQGENPTLGFTNTYGDGETAEAVLNGNKAIALADPTLTGPTLADIAGKYTFTLTGVDGAPMPEGSNGNTLTAQNDAAGGVYFGTITYTMANVFGESSSTDATEGDVSTQVSEPRSKTFTYEVTESGEVAGITNEGGTKTIEVTVTDNGDGTLSVDVAPASGAAEGMDFTFTNTYDVEDVTTTPTGEGGVTITKTLDGRTMDEGEFTFQMVETGATEPVATATNGANGSVSFGGITFTQPGTYTYEISEVPGEQSNGVSYDRSVYTATAVVTDTGTGTLSVEWTVKNAAGEEVEQIEFANGYTTTPASATFGGSKVLNGATLEDGQFSFRLSDAEGNEVQTVQNAADGSFVFDTLTFDAPGTYEYTISEVLPEDDDATTDGIQQDGVTYDEATWTVEVTVSDNRKGQLTITGLTYNGETEFPVFTNTYTEPPAPEPDDDNEGPLMQTSDGTFTAIAAVLGLGVVSIAAGVVMKKRGE